MPIWQPHRQVYQNPHELPPPPDGLSESERAQYEIMQSKGAAPLHAECLDPTITRNELHDLHDLIEEGVDKGQWLQWMEPVTTASGYEKVEGVGAVLIDGKEIPVVKIEYEGEQMPLVPYPYLIEIGIIDLPSPKQYFAFLSSIIRTPNDVHRLISPPFGEWQDFGGRFDPFSDEPQHLDQMEDEYVTLGKGGGACSELSWLAKRFLDVLSCRNGYDYKAMVIGSGTHAVCVYQDQNGNWNSIDQVDHYRDIQDSYEASDLFEHGRNITEFLLYKRNIRLEYPLDPVTRERQKDYMVAQVYNNYPGNENFDINDYVPTDWTSYDEVQLFFYDGTRVYYRDGALFEIIDSKQTKTWYAADDGHVIQVQDPTGKLKMYSRKPHGRLLQVRYPHGVREYFDRETGTQVVRTVFEDHEDRFDFETGDLTERHHFHEDPAKVHKIEYFYADATSLSGQVRRVEYVDEDKEEVKLAINFDQEGAPTWDSHPRGEPIRVQTAPEWDEDLFEE